MWIFVLYYVGGIWLRFSLIWFVLFSYHWGPGCVASKYIFPLSATDKREFIVLPSNQLRVSDLLLL